MIDGAPIERDLRALNIEIPLKESEGDRPYFERLLHEAFVFRRAGGDIDDKSRFLARLTKSQPRETEIHDVHLHGNRAVVTSIVTMRLDDGVGHFHNLRLFLRGEDGKWRLLAWANERVPARGR